jgi:hypothetical protein
LFAFSPFRLLRHEPLMLSAYLYACFCLRLALTSLPLGPGCFCTFLLPWSFTDILCPSLFLSLPLSLSCRVSLMLCCLPFLSLFVRWCPRFRSLYIFATGPKDCPMLRAMHSLYHRSRSQEPHAVSMIRNARLDWISPPWYPSLFCSHVDDDDARTGHHPGHRN